MHTDTLTHNETNLPLFVFFSPIRLRGTKWGEIWTPDMLPWEIGVGWKLAHFDSQL